MPEIAEIARFGITINAKCKGIVFNKAKVDAHPKFSQFPSIGDVFLSARNRGKELALVLTPASNGSKSTTIIWNFGLVGRFIVHPVGSVPPYAMVTFFAKDNSLGLSYCDMQKMGKFRIDDFDRKRGPDPVLDHAAFVAHITKNHTKPAFDKDLAEVLLNQDYFNGIGNYMRAEVCYRAGVSPFTNARALFSDLPNTPYSYDSVGPNSPKSHIVLYLCRAITLEVLSMGLNKYGTPEEFQVFTNWLRIYDKGEHKEVGGRKVHFRKDAPKTADLPVPVPSLPHTFVGDVYPDSFVIGETSITAGISTQSSSTPISKAAPTPIIVPPSNRHISESSQTKAMQQNQSQAKNDLFKFDVNHLAIFNLPEQKENHTMLTNSKAIKFPHLLGDAKELILSDQTSNTTRLLLIISRLHKGAFISNSEKDVLKVLTLTHNSGLSSALTVFLNDYDMSEFVDSCKHLANKGLPENYAYSDGKTVSQPKVVSPATSLNSTLPGVSAYSDSSVSSYASSYASAYGSSAMSAPPPGQMSLTSMFSAAPSAPSAYSSTSSLPQGAPSGLTDSEWASLLSEEFTKPYFTFCLNTVANERKTKSVYPAESEVFAAFNYTPLSNVKAVIIGQDPYFNEGQAHGLCFSVQKGVKVPPSLMRMYKVLEKTIPGFQVPSHGNLESWARQGVLLLNATLTVEKGKPNSHAAFGWQQFTDRAIELLAKEKKGIVFLLWGGFAQAKGAKIDKVVHKVLVGPHPSPMSGSDWNDVNHFAEANEYLKSIGKTPIDWRIN